METSRSGGIDGLESGLFRALLAGGRADAHEGRAGVRHDGADVREVDVDDAGSGDEVGDALDCLAEDVVAHGERFLEVGVLIGELEELVVRDDDDGVHFFRQVFESLFRELHAVRAFEEERLGDHADSEYALLLCGARHDRRGSRARAAAHAAGDEDHVSALDDILDLRLRLFGRLLADFRIHAGAEALGEGSCRCGSFSLPGSCAGPGYRCSC